MGGGVVTTFGRSLLSGAPLLSGGSLLSGFTSRHKKLTLISGGCFFRGVVTIGTLRYSFIGIFLDILPKFKVALSPNFYFSISKRIHNLVKIKKRIE